jgi:hypothetical protein
LTTVMLNMPAEFAEPVAVSCVAETKVVVSGVLPNSTCAPETKFVPLTVRLKLPVPMLAGFVPASVGVGFISVTALEALAELGAALVAVTVTVFGLGSEDGAV